MFSQVVILTYDFQKEYFDELNVICDHRLDSEQEEGENIILQRY